MENFPYKSIAVPRTEADDIVAILCKHYHTQENIIIVSSDKDFQQLQRFPNIKQYSPIHKKFLVCKDPEKFLIEHIIKGDSSDGIPNILSDDDVFMTEGKRQKGCGAKKISQIMEETENWSDSPNWNRNQILVDLSLIPEEYEEKILHEFNTAVCGDRSKIFNYFIQHKLNKLIGSIQEF